MYVCIIFLMYKSYYILSLVKIDVAKDSENSHVLITNESTTKNPFKATDNLLDYFHECLSIYIPSSRFSLTLEINLYENWMYIHCGLD
jgi:hypothetical protein